LFHRADGGRGCVRPIIAVPYSSSASGVGKVGPSGGAAAIFSLTEVSVSLGLIVVRYLGSPQPRTRMGAVTARRQTPLYFGCLARPICGAPFPLLPS
jgi:hypothetical protein